MKAYQEKLTVWLGILFRYPLPLGMILSILTSIYLIYDVAVVNYGSLDMLWNIQQFQKNIDHSVLLTPGTEPIAFISNLLGGRVVFSAYLVMVVTHALITGILILMARRLGFSLLTQWAFILLLLSHPNYNDFRVYIIIEPLFWLLWLAAIYCLLRWHRDRSVLAITLWLTLLLIGTYLSVVGWFWLLLFPFGALFWKPWRRKSVAYALLGYALIVGVLLFLPLYQGEAPIQWFMESVINNPNELAQVLSLDNNWVKEDDHLLSGVFIFSGASSLIIIRLLIMLSIVSLFLLIYAILKKQYQIINHNLLRIIVYAIVFDLFISIVLMILAKDGESVMSFSTVFLCLFFSALGLSYVFKKMQAGHYSRLTVLVIVWCLVAYIANGFIIFGPKKDYIKTAAQTFIAQYPTATVYSNDALFAFYTGNSPDDIIESDYTPLLKSKDNTYYAYAQSRKKSLPKRWQAQTPLAIFANQRGDRLLIFTLDGTGR